MAEAEKRWFVAGRFRYVVKNFGWSPLIRCFSDMMTEFMILRGPGSADALDVAPKRSSTKRGRADHRTRETRNETGMSPTRTQLPQLAETWVLHSENPAASNPLTGNASHMNISLYSNTPQTTQLPQSYSQPHLPQPRPDEWSYTNALLMAQMGYDQLPGTNFTVPSFESGNWAPSNSRGSASSGHLANFLDPAGRLQPAPLGYSGNAFDMSMWMSGSAQHLYRLALSFQSYYLLLIQLR